MDQSHHVLGSKATPNPRTTGATVKNLSSPEVTPEVPAQQQERQLSTPRSRLDRNLSPDLLEKDHTVIQDTVPDEDPLNLIVFMENIVDMDLVPLSRRIPMSILRMVQWLNQHELPILVASDIDNDI
jgi:hypothetical protein